MRRLTWMNSIDSCVIMAQSPWSTHADQRDRMPRLPVGVRHQRPSGWSKAVKEEVWAKALRVPGEDPSRVRQDAQGNIITRENVAIDHHVPLSKGGPNHITNLQPLHKDANRDKSDHMPTAPAWVASLQSGFRP